jgi:hypothetical protein
LSSGVRVLNAERKLILCASVMGQECTWAIEFDRRSNEV